MLHLRQRLLSERFELHCEVAHKFGFPYDLHATGDFMTTVIHVLERSGNHIHMVVGVSAAADAETQEVVSAETVLTGYGITVGKDVADFAATHAGFTIKLHSERLGENSSLGMRSSTLSASMKTAWPPTGR